jgi:hypothetical protein
MRISASAFIRWAVLLAAVYLAALGLWRLFEPSYIRSLAAGVAALDLMGLLPVPVQAVPLPGKGLAVIGSGLESLAIPQRIVGADLALAAALVAATPWLPWKARPFKLLLALVFVFTAHLGTIFIQAWVNTTDSGGALAAWNLWSALYQGKVVPILAWFVVIAPAFFLDVRATRRPASA